MDSDRLADAERWVEQYGDYLYRYADSLEGAKPHPSDSLSPAARARIRQELKRL